MNTGLVLADRTFFIRWVRGTFFGWLLGFVISMVGLMLGELISMPGDEFGFGIGMGVGVGYAQARVARQWLGATGPWVWASVIGLGVPFVAFDLIRAFWSEFPGLFPRQFDAVVIGGLFVGFLQLRILRPHSERASWWVPACVVGWTLAALMPDVTFSGSGDAILNLIMILMGGVVLGVVTGGALVWMLRR